MTKVAYYSGEMADEAYDIANDCEEWAKVLKDAIRLLKTAGLSRNSVKEDVQYATKMFNQAMYYLKEEQNALNRLSKEDIQDED